MRGNSGCPSRVLTAPTVIPLGRERDGLDRLRGSVEPPLEDPPSPLRKASGVTVELDELDPDGVFIRRVLCVCEPEVDVPLE